VKIYAQLGLTGTPDKLDAATWGGLPVGQKIGEPRPCFRERMCDFSEGEREERAVCAEHQPAACPCGQEIFECFPSDRGWTHLRAAGPADISRAPGTPKDVIAKWHVSAGLLIEMNCAANISSCRSSYSLGVAFLTRLQDAPPINWDSRVGHYTYAQAVTELGPPSSAGQTQRRQSRVQMVCPTLWSLPTSTAACPTYGSTGFARAQPSEPASKTDGFN